jgi:type IV secretion system protein VirB4
MPHGDRAADEAFAVLCPFDGLFLTDSGSLIGAVELSGIDPDGMTRPDAARLVAMTANIANGLPADVAITQFYVHAEGTTVTFRDRPANPIANRLIRAREAALSARGLTTTRLVHFLEYADPEGWNGGFLVSLLTNLPKAAYDHEARIRLEAMVSAPGALILREAELRDRAQLLKKALADYAAKWSLTMDAAVLSATRTWRFMTFLARLDNRYLDDAVPIQVPLDDCGLALPAGDIEPIQSGHVDMLKLTGPRPRYIRYAAIVRAPKDPIGSWSLGADAPLLARGNYVVETHFAPLSPLQRTFRFRAARNRLERSRIDLAKLVSGMTGSKAAPAAETETFGFQRKRLELEQAEDDEDRYAELFSQLCVYDPDPEQLVRSCDRLCTGARISSQQADDHACP